MVCKIAIIEFIILNSATFQGFTNNNRCILLLVSDNKITELFFIMDEFYQVFDKIMKKMHQRIGESVLVIGITPFLRPKSCLLSSFFMIKDTVTTIISIMTRSARIFVFFFQKRRHITVWWTELHFASVTINGLFLKKPNTNVEGVDDLQEHYLEFGDSNLYRDNFQRRAFISLSSATASVFAS